jgi:hypothetical protein
VARRDAIEKTEASAADGRGGSSVGKPDRTEGSRRVTEEEKQEHRRLGKELNNLVWQLLQKKDRTADEDETMVHAAHASCYHWSVAGTAVNVARGEWLISHVYALLERAGPALHHAKRCLETVRANEIGDFDLAYAHEGMARALAANRQKAEFEKYFRLSQEAGARIQEEEDRDLFYQDFKAEPWFGMS